MKINRTGKTVALVGLLLVAFAVLFAACRKNDPHTGLFIYVTEPDGNIATNESGEPITEEWITHIEYATNDEGKTYTNANGDKVTVKQTRPALTRVLQVTGVLQDKDGKPLTQEDGSRVTGVLTRQYSRAVTEQDGSRKD